MQKTKNPYVTDVIAENHLSSPQIDVLLPLQFAQCSEDYIVLSLLRALALKENLDLRKEKYCEIGANHPYASNSTYLLHIGLGMTGALVEANPDLIDTLKKSRPHDAVYSYAITPEKETEVEIHISNLNELSSINKNHIDKFSNLDARALKSIKVPALTIDQLMEKAFPTSKPIFLSIDVEGLDLAIMESYSFNHRPYILQIEGNASASEIELGKIKSFLEKKRYHIVASTDVNQIAIDMDRISESGITSSFGLSLDSIETLISKVDIVSLDVFDTILTRRCLQPTDVFHWLENKLSIPGFAEARIEAEESARKRSKSRGPEVSIEEIYDSFDFSIQAKLPENAVEKEIDAEKKFLFPNQSIMKLVETSRRLGKRVIAVSDMYLSSSQISSILKHHDISLDEVYASSDFREENLGKYNGKLFDHVLEVEDTQPTQVLHVGDNHISDIKNSQTKNIIALHTKILHDAPLADGPFTTTMRTPKESPSQRTIIGQITQNAHGNTPRVSTAEHYGYTCGGPLILGFLLYIRNLAKSQDLDKLLLMERDGCIIHEAILRLPDWDIETKLVPCSRRMAIFPTYHDGNPERLLRLFSGEAISEKSFFEQLVLTPPVPLPMGVGVIRSPAEHISAYEDFLKLQAQTERAALQAEFSDDLVSLENGKKFAWVDVGWALSAATGMNDALGIDAPCFCIGATSYVDPHLRHEGYLFKKDAPLEVASPIMQAPELIELIFSSEKPSTVYLKTETDGNQTRVIKPSGGEEQIRNGFVCDIHRGALQFIEDIADLAFHLSSEDLRTMNMQAWSKLCRNPSQSQYDALATIPHDRFAGDFLWKTIGDYWCPQHIGPAPVEIPMEVVPDTIKMDQIKEMLLNERAKPFKNAWRLIEHHALRRLSKCSPPLPSRMTARFAASAQKRDPYRPI